MKRILTALFLLSAPAAFAQESTPDSTVIPQTPGIRLMTRCKGGKVQLRWLPTSSAVWRVGNKNGYILERMELTEEGGAKGYTQIGGLLKPTEAAAWERLAGSNEYLRGAKEAVYSTPKKIAPGSGFEAMADQQNEENGIYYSFVLCTNLDPLAAKEAATFYEDATAVVGKDYAYRIRIATAPKMVGADTPTVFLTAVQNTTGPKVGGLSTEALDGVIKISWDYETSRKNFTAYFLERSADNGATYQQINTLPIVISIRSAEEVIYKDSTAKNYVRYAYRMRGLTPFGDKSAPSGEIYAMSRDFTPPPAPVLVQGAGSEAGVNLSWQMPHTSPDLAGFKVARAPKSDGPFTLVQEALISKTATTFTDTKPLSREPFYVVYSVDTAGNMANGFATMAVLIDTIPPAMPTALTGTVDSLGYVTLSWAANGEEDLAGYNVYVANKSDNVFRQMNGDPVLENSFRDTINMRDLNRNIYYKITAVDYNNNPSPYATLLTLRRPDVIPPAAPVIHNFAVTDNAVKLDWIPSSSDDVIFHQLVRMDAAGKSETLRTAVGDTTFTDKDLPAGTYTYVVIAADSSHRTASKPLAVVVDKNSTDGIKSLKAAWKSAEEAVLLDWAFDGKDAEHQYLLFRGKDAEALTPLRRLRNGQTSWKDEDAAAGTWYYAVKVQYAGGTESALSEAVKLEVPASTSR